MATAAPRQPIKTLVVCTQMLEGRRFALSERQLGYKRQVEDALDSVAKSARAEEGDVLAALANVAAVIEREHDPALADVGRTIAIDLLLLEARADSQDHRNNDVVRMVPKAKMALDTSLNMMAPVLADH